MPQPPHSLAHGEYNASNPDIDMDVELPHFNPDYTPPGSYVDFSQEVNPNSPPGGGQHVSNPLRVTHVYHPKLDGKLCSLCIALNVY